jgi:hypothetical protein
MLTNQIISELSKSFDPKLAKDLVDEFLELRKDLQTSTLSRASAGKFVETVVQILEFLETGVYSVSPNVDAYLKGLESRTSTLNDDLRISLSRIARATYTLRNKRNILHKGLIDPNIYDLRFIFSSGQWILTEFIRQYVTSDIHKAGEIVEFIQLPVGSIIEHIDGRKIIHADLSVKEEILVTLYSYYPEKLTIVELCQSLDRRVKNSVYKGVKSLWDEKLVHEKSKGFMLSQPGFAKAQEILKNNSLGVPVSPP